MTIIETSATLNKMQRKILLESSNKIFYDSNFGFLKNHNGWRNGCVHLFIGATSAGKSTLVRTLIADLLQSMSDDKDKTKSVMLYLSEETRIEFLTELARSEFNTDLDRLKIYSEISLLKKFNSLQEIWAYLRLMIVEENIKFVFFDNITTSRFYEGETIKNQASFSYDLKNLAIDYDIPVAVVAHTGAQVSDNMSRFIEVNDVRGSKNINNVSQFAYILQRYIIKNEIHPTIRIVKHRGQDSKSKLFYLRYIPSARMYGCDTEISFEEAKRLHKERNVL